MFNVAGEDYPRGNSSTMFYVRTLQLRCSTCGSEKRDAGLTDGQTECNHVFAFLDVSAASITDRSFVSYVATIVLR